MIVGTMAALGILTYWMVIENMFVERRWRDEEILVRQDRRH